MEEHQKHFKLCPLVMGISRCNILIGTTRRPQTLRFFFNACEAAGNKAVERTVPALFKNNARSPVYPQYKRLNMRALSFRGQRTVVDIPKLSVAGFFHTGEDDKTRCFTCGLGVQGWQSGDDPMIVHARHSQNCYYLIQLKGEACVRQHRRPDKTEMRDIISRMNTDRVALVLAAGVPRGVVQ